MSDVINKTRRKVMQRLTFFYKTSWHKDEKWKWHFRELESKLVCKGRHHFNRQGQHLGLCNESDKSLESNLRSSFYMNSGQTSLLLQMETKLRRAKFTEWNWRNILKIGLWLIQASGQSKPWKAHLDGLCLNQICSNQK